MEVLRSIAGSEGWVPPSVLWLDHTTITNGITNVRTFATKNYPPAPDDKYRVRLCKYDSVLVKHFHVPAGASPTDDSVYAYVHIESTHADDRITGEHLRKGLKHLVDTYNTAVQEALQPRTAPWPPWSMVANPPATPTIATDLHEIMMIAVQAGWVNIRHTRARVTTIDAPTDPQTTPVDSQHDHMASQSSTQHDPQTRHNPTTHEVQVPHQTDGMDVRAAPSPSHSGH